jgi:signal transduction histidine kinase
MPFDRFTEPPVTGFENVPRPIRSWLLQEDRGPSATPGLASVVMHELRQSLTALTFTGHAIRLNVAQAGWTPALGSMLDEMIGVSQHAGEVLHRLHTLTREEKIQTSVVDLNQLVTDALKLTKQELGRHGVRSTFDAAESLPFVHADAVQIILVLTNLIRNACDSLAEVPLLERRLAVTTYLTALGEVAVAIEDSGTGIADDVRAKLFHQFKTAKPAGLGIGLTICRLIAEAHGATITAGDSESGRGARFVLTFPTSGELSTTCVNDEAPAHGFCRR